MLQFSKVGVWLRPSSQKNQEVLGERLRGRTVVVTGANSGLGFWLARFAARKGAKLIIVCRDPAKGRRALEQIQLESNTTDIELAVTDMSESLSVESLALQYQDRKIDCLIHNAGVLLDQRQTNTEGVERTFATAVLGPFLLTERWLASGALDANSRVIMVASGGQYGRPLQLSDWNWSERPFNGVAAYAEAKRAQVVLTQEWARRRPAGHFFSMHPGWVATPGLSTSLPTFQKLMSPLLRNEQEGCDTIVWLATEDAAKLNNGGFYFDRRAVATDWWRSTVTSDEDRRKLWQLLTDKTQAAPT
jgi:NAD(P)-dependent dehydrogenase (short-subunit alcohol dehydrogenase family)